MSNRIRRPEPEASGIVVRLYIAGNAPNSVAALSNLRAVLAAHGQRAILETIDVVREPARGLRDGILVTPTLVRIAPAPQCRIVGTLSDRAALLATLGLEPGMTKGDS